MKYTTIDSIHDPMGAAIRDYHLRGKAARLRVMSSMFDEDEMPVDHLFRTFDYMPHLVLATRNPRWLNFDIRDRVVSHSIR